MNDESPTIAERSCRRSPRPGSGRSRATAARPPRRTRWRAATGIGALLGVLALPAVANPPLPTGFRHEVYSDTAAEIFWERSDHAEPVRGYEVTRDGESLGVLDVLSVFEDTLVPGVDYTYTVTAVGRHGERSPTASLVLRTPKSADTIASLRRENARLAERFASEVPAPLPRTGQGVSRRAGDDGDLRTGVESPSPRFVRGVTAGEDLDANGRCDGAERCDGTVIDRLTGLVWLAQADCFGRLDWAAALDGARSLADDGAGTCGLGDGSVAGDWRLPNVREMMSLLDFSRLPTFPSEHPFDGVVTFEESRDPARYWTSTSRTGFDGAHDPDRLSGYAVSIGVGWVESWTGTATFHVWPVR